MLNKSLHKLFNNPKLKLDAQCFPLRNSPVDFMGTDNERLWKKNKDNPNLQFYKENKITYELNNFGYRTPYNFKYGDEVDIYLGCSHTIGYGIIFEQTWPYLVNKYLEGNLASLAVGGCSIDRQFRELYTWMNFFKIRNIFHFQPFYAREEFITDSKYIKFSVHTPPKHLNQENTVEYFGSDTHILKKYVTNILAIKSIASRLNAKYFYLYNIPEFIGTPARDNMHMDINGHKTIAEQFVSKYKTNDLSIDFIDDDFKVEREVKII